MTLDPSSASSIEECQSLLDSVTLKSSLSFIKKSFTIIATTIESSEKQGLMIREVIDMV